MSYNDEWRKEAKCKGMPLEIFFVGSRINQERVLPQAKAACDSCPVKSECLEDAIVTKTTNGVRAGLTGAERRVLIRARESLIPKKARPDHGTRSGYFWELKNGMEPCFECRQADVVYKVRRRGGYVYRTKTQYL